VIRQLHIKLPRTLLPPAEGYPKEELNAAYKSICDNEHIIKQISKGTKAEGNIGNLAVLLDTLFIELNDNLPAYLPPGLHLNLAEVKLLGMNVYTLLSQTSKSIVSGAVSLLEDILEKAKSKIAGKAPKQKAFLYSLHDINISACLAALNITSRPTYGGILLIELHKHPETKEHFIKIMYKKKSEDTGELQNIKVNGDFLVKISNFEKLLQNFASTTENLSD